MTRLLLLVVVTVTLMTGLATTAQAVDIPTVSYKLLHPTPKAMRILELLSAMEVEDKDKGFKYIGAVATCKRTGLARNKTGLGWRHLTCAVKTTHGYRLIVKWIINNNVLLGISPEVTRIA